MPKLNYHYEDESGEEHDVDLPASWHICDNCHGDGKSSAYLGSFTMEQMNEDPDFADEYMNGGYDKTCTNCGGSGKVLIVDREAKMTAEQTAALADIDTNEQAKADLRRDEASERHMMGDYS